MATSGGEDDTAAAPELPGAVLFCCTYNAVRSVMASAILRHLVGKRAYVRSGGVHAGEADQFVVAVLAEIGIDASGHKPRRISDLNDTSFDLIVSLSPEAHHTALEMTRTMAVDVEYWPTFDATLSLGQGNRQQTLDSYRRVRDQLFRKLKARFSLDGGPSV